MINLNNKKIISMIFTSFFFSNTFAATPPSCADLFEELAVVEAFVKEEPTNQNRDKSKKRENYSKSLGLEVRQEQDILSAGDKIKTPEGLKLIVEKVVLDGHKGIVYKAREANGTPYAVKIPRFDLDNYNYDVIKSLAKEPLKIPDYIELGIRYAKIVEYGEDYLVKEWVEGIRGDEWILDWVKLSKRKQKKDRRYLQLMDLFEVISAQGSYVGNLKSINLIHNGDDWIIVDSSTPELNSDTPKNIRIKYDRVFKKRWVRDL